MRLVWVVLLVAIAHCAVPNEPLSLQPETTDLEKGTQKWNKEQDWTSPEAQRLFTSSIQQERKPDTNPSAAKCFLILAVSFVIVNLILFVIQQIKFFRGKFMPVVANDGGETQNHIISETTLRNVQSTLNFTPTVSLLMLFILFRAVNQDLDMNGSSYTSAQTGMWITTIGLLILTIDGFLISQSNETFSNISEMIGTGLTYFGYILLTVGLVSARNPIIPMSTGESCIVALSVLLLVTMVALKALQLKDRFIPAQPMPESLQVLSRFMSDTLFEKISSVSSFVPVLITAFFYLHFYYVKVGKTPEEAEVGMIASTVGVYIQVVALFLRIFHDTAGAILHLLGVLLTYTFFAVTMYSAITAGWPPSSIAISFTLILLFALALLKLVIVVVQEASTKILGTTELSEEDKEVSASGNKFARMMKLFKDMMTTANYALILCVFMLYFHFRGQYLIKTEPRSYIKSIGSLVGLMYLAVVSIFAQMLLQVIELGSGPSIVLSVLVLVSITFVNVALGGITIAAVST